MFDLFNRITFGGQNNKCLSKHSSRTLQENIILATKF